MQSTIYMIHVYHVAVYADDVHPSQFGGSGGVGPIFRASGPMTRRRRCSDPELPTDLAGPDELGQQSIVPLFVTDPARDDRRMHLHCSCQIHHGHWRRAVSNRACVPDRPRDEGRLCPFVGLLLPRIFLPPNYRTQRQIVDECASLAAVHVASSWSAAPSRYIFGRCLSITSGMPCFARNSCASFGPVSAQLSRSSWRSRADGRSCGRAPSGPAKAARRPECRDARAARAPSAS